MLLLLVCYDPAMSSAGAILVDICLMKLELATSHELVTLWTVISCSSNVVHDLLQGIFHQVLLTSICF